jgi:hypothetical protein
MAATTHSHRTTRDELVDDDLASRSRAVYGVLDGGVIESVTRRGAEVNVWVQ